jgi:hypothetical protein
MFHARSFTRTAKQEFHFPEAFRAPQDTMVGMRTPWLLAGILAGTAIGYLAIPWFQHGREVEAYYLFRPAWGAMGGLIVGLMIEVSLGLYRRRKARRGNLALEQAPD